LRAPQRDTLLESITWDLQLTLCFKAISESTRRVGGLSASFWGGELMNRADRLLKSGRLRSLCTLLKATSNSRELRISEDELIKMQPTLLQFRRGLGRALLGEGKTSSAPNQDP